MAACAGISLETALVSARQALASVAERAKQPSYYSRARTDIINAHADLRAALDMLVKAAGSSGAPPVASSGRYPQKIAVGSASISRRTSSTCTDGSSRS